MPCKKSKRMADGGILLADAGTKETPEQLLARMNAKYGLGDAGKPVAQTAPQPAPAPAPTPPAGQAPAASASGGMFGKTIDAVGRRADELNRVSRYARGGIMPVIGAGSGTSDSVPAIVAGQKVRLSNGEGAAILPAKTMKNKAAVHAIEEIIEATNGKPTATSDEDDAGLACGGVKARKMAGGGVLEQPEDDNQNSSKIPGVVRNGNSFSQANPAPTAQEVYQPAVDAVKNAPQLGSPLSIDGGKPAPTAQDLYGGVSLKGIADALTPGTGSAVPGVVRNGNSFTQTPPDATATTPANLGDRPSIASRIIAAIPDGGYLASPEGRQAIAKGISGEGIRPDTGILGPRAAADSAKPTTSSPVASTAQASYSNEGRPSAISAVNGLDSSPLASNTGNAGDARLNAQNGILSFTSKGFDPTNQQFAPGTGAITDPKTGRTMLLTGPDQGTANGSPAASLVPPSVANPGAGRDAYGNSTAVTRQLQGELAKAQAENAKAQADYDARFGNRPTYEQQQQAEADRFNRFVRQSTADSLAHDLATGGGTARSNAGKIAALNAIQRGLNSENDTSAAQNIAAMRARSGIAETRMLGDNRLAETALQGQNNLAVENVRQGSPSTALLARKMQGEIADADAVRAVRNEIADSAASGNQTAYNNAVKKGIAFGILKNERPANEFAFAPSSLGGGHVIDKATGSLMRIDAEGKATPVQMPGQQKKPTASKDAIEFLKKNPDLAGKFDEMYGPGEAKKILGK